MNYTSTKLLKEKKGDGRFCGAISLSVALRWVYSENISLSFESSLEEGEQVKHKYKYTLEKSHTMNKRPGIERTADCFLDAPNVSECSHLHGLG